MAAESLVLDSVINSRPALEAFLWMLGNSRYRLAILDIAVGATIVIALLQAASAYLNAYYTVSIGQRIAHDLRQSVYAHLHRLSMSYYDRRQTGPLISTITDDINAVQDFVSTSLLDILLDGLTIIGMLAVMFSLNRRFTLVALAVTPFLAVFVYRLQSVVKAATHGVRRRQSELVTIVQEGLGSIRVVKAFAQGAFERERLSAKSLESVEAALYARRVRSLLGPVVTAMVALGTAAVLWFGARLVLANAMTARALVVFLTYLGKLFQPTQDVARASRNIAQAAVGLERVRVHPEIGLAAMGIGVFSGFGGGTTGSESMENARSLVREARVGRRACVCYGERCESTHCGYILADAFWIGGRFGQNPLKINQI